MNTSALIEGREACIAAWRDLLVGLPDSGARVLWCIDTDFADWPFNDMAVLDALFRWAREPGRMLQMVARDYEAVARRFPRLAAWRRDWSHCIQPWRPLDDEIVELPGVLSAGRQAIELLDPEHWRARRLTEAADLRRVAEMCDAIAQRCEPAWPATVLGL